MVSKPLILETTRIDFDDRAYYLTGNKDKGDSVATYRVDHSHLTIKGIIITAPSEGYLGVHQVIETLIMVAVGNINREIWEKAFPKTFYTYNNFTGDLDLEVTYKDGEKLTVTSKYNGDAGIITQEAAATLRLLFDPDVVKGKR